MVCDSTLDLWVQKAQAGKLLTECELRQLCEYVTELLMEESNVQPVSSPVVICGDIHGQFYDLLELFRTGGRVEEGTSYIFMGDYVDRGLYSVETFTYLMALKARYPNQITLLRGNHESRQITQVYGFYDECMHKYGSANAWKHCMQVFDYLVLAALVDGRVMCVHGGLSPDARTLDQIRLIARNQEIPHEGVFCDLMWSDPEPDVAGWQKSPRNAGFMFGARMVMEFSRVNGLELICRAHQLVQEGYAYVFPERSLVTVWSAPNYCGRCGNLASVLSLDGNLERDFKLFNTVPDPNQPPSAPRTTVPYFL